MSEINNIRDKFSNDGFCHLPSFLSNSKYFNDVLNKIREVSILRLEKISSKNYNFDKLTLDEILFELLQISENNISFINDVINSHQSILNLFNDVKITELVDGLLHCHNSFICINNHKFRIQSPGRDDISNLPWHQDSHYNSMGTDNHSLAVWVSLSEINNELGPVIFKKGSNKIGKTVRKKIIKPNGNPVYTIDKKLINSKEFEEVSIETASGDVMLIHMNVLHTSGSNKSNITSKLSAQARYHQAASENFLPQYN